MDLIKYEYKFDNYEQRDFFETVLDLAIENLALRKYDNIINAPIKELCAITNKCTHHFWNGKRRFNFSREKLNAMLYISSVIINQIHAEYSTKDLIQSFYFEKMRNVFDMSVLPDFFNPKFDDYGFPIESPLEVRSYAASLYDFFDTVTQLVPTSEYVTELPYELRINFYTPMEHKIKTVLENIILGRSHKGLSLYALFFYRVPPNERITHSLLISKFFLRLCSSSLDNFFLVNDDIHSIDFKSAVLDRITFIDESNKILFDNKMIQARHNFVAETIEAALLAEIEKKYNI